jgi:hypothetical protein
LKKVTYPLNTTAWLVTKTSVLNPVEKKWRIKIEGAWYGAKGEVIRAAFVWKGKVCKMTPYGEVMHMGNLIAEGMTIRLSAKYERERYIEGLCRMACDPTSETYWSM